MKIALFFGSFNPVHVGHLIIANTIANQPSIDRVWFVVSPQNPFKEKKSLLHEFDRYDLIKMAIEDSPQLDVSNIEFSMPKPSYTIDTLTQLKEQFPSYEFSIIMGSDNLGDLHKWKNYEAILKYYEVIIFPRPHYVMPKKYQNHPSIHVLQVPLLDISATYIRKQIQSGKNIRFLVSDVVKDRIEEKGLYL